LVVSDPSQLTPRLLTLLLAVFLHATEQTLGCG
jgi:hypothetical protein